MLVDLDFGLNDIIFIDAGSELESLIGIWNFIIIHEADLVTERL